MNSVEQEIYFIILLENKLNAWTWPCDAGSFTFDPHCCLDLVIAESLENHFRIKFIIQKPKTSEVRAGWNFDDP